VGRIVQPGRLADAPPGVAAETGGNLRFFPRYSASFGQKPRAGKRFFSCDTARDEYSRCCAASHGTRRFISVGCLQLLDMSTPSPASRDVEQLLLNARLRDELEPFVDESLCLLRAGRLPTEAENEFLAQMLAWERAPVLPISRWFEPELILPPPSQLDDATLHRLLWETIHRLYSQRIVLEFTDHLSDRELYCRIARDLLPSPEKKLDLPRNYLHWHFLDIETQPEIWLSYYASDEEREMWAAETGQPLPPRRQPPYPRRMPRRPA